jgi:DNA-binding NarL/FixJ family response regulator
VLAGGESAVVVLSGEPGIGKTALLGEVIERSRALGYRALRAQASELERDLPFAVFVQALEGEVAAMTPARLEPLGDAELAQLSAAFPALAPAGANPTARAVPDDRHRLLSALHALVSRLASERPLVLALDDLHWADPASIDLLCRLLHRGLGERSLLLAASRPGQSEPRLKAAFAEAERHGRALVIELSPLSAAESRELIGADIDRDAAAAIYEQSGGNPLYLEHLAAAARRGAAVPAREDRVHKPSVPRGVSTAIDDELRRLSGSQRRLLQGAAVAGDPFDIDLSAEAAGVPHRVAMADLDALLAWALLFPAGPPQRYRFRHPIVRDAVYERAGSGWRIQAHRRVAGALEQRGASASALAPHVERSARVGDAAAAAILAQAGEELMWRAPASAARWFDGALRLTDEHEANRELRLTLSAQRAAALGFDGQIAEGRDELYRFLALAPQEPNELRVQMAVLCAGFGELLGCPDEARALLLAELSKLSDTQGHEGARLKLELACACFNDADLKTTRRFAKQALQARCEGLTRVGALAMLALGELCLGNLARASRALDEAAGLTDRISNDKVASGGVSVMSYLAAAESQIERFESAVRHAERALTIMRPGGHRYLAVNLLVIQGFALAAMGRARELLALNDETMEAALLSPSQLFLSLAMTGRSFAFLMAGDLFAALSYAERGAALVAATRSPLTMTSHVQLAHALMELGEVERSLDALGGLEGDPELPPFPPYPQALARELVVRARIARGDLQQAEDFARRAHEGAMRLGLGTPIAFARRALSLVLLERGKAKDAIEEALASYEAADATGAPVEAARSQIAAGKALAVCGNRHAAVVALRSAHATLLETGALRYADQAAKELRRLGRAMPRKRSDSGTPSVLGLSPRECQVMELVAAGKTNQQIADDLYLSRRTIDRHLARIFEKLDVHSRAAAASAFERARSHVPA